MAACLFRYGENLERSLVVTAPGGEFDLFVIRGPAVRDIVPRIKEGVDFWWTDHTDRVSGEIKPGVPSRNLLGPLWNRLLSNAMADQGKGERLSLSRGGGIGSQISALPWPGDTVAGIDRFAEDIWFCLNAACLAFR